MTNLRANKMTVNANYHPFTLHACNSVFLIAL